MSAITVAVTCTASDQNGNPVAGARYRARLNQTEIHNGFVVPEVVDGVADSNGVCVLHLWPNALGVAGSQYTIQATNPDTGKKFLSATVSVPNNACNLHEILVQEPYPPIDAAQQALAAAQGALALATTQAGIATTRATQALDSQNAAAGYAADAAADRVQTGQDRAATGQDRAQTGLDAATATTKASEASASASTATTKAGEAAASAALFPTLFTQMATSLIQTQTIVATHHAFN